MLHIRTIHLIIVASLTTVQNYEVNCQNGWFKSIGFDPSPFPIEQMRDAAGTVSRFMIEGRGSFIDKKAISRPNKSGKQKQVLDPRKSNDDDQYKYSAMCLLKRSPKYSSNPTLHFFPASLHSPDTFVCQNSIQLPLNISKTIYSDYGDEDGDEIESYVLDLNLKRDFIETGLYNSSLDTYILVHGFLASWNGDNWMCRVKDMILNNTQANVFILDWSGGSKPMLPIDYSQSVSNTDYVGHLMGSFINELLKYSGQANANKFHLIGHSLGAHICGFAGYTVRSIGTITALDPAGPCYGSISVKSAQQAEHAQLSGYLNTNGDSNKRRLSPLCAKLVLALHTDTSMFGLNENCAHFDIYVNGGSDQPGCANQGLPFRVGSLLDLDLANALNADFTCAHSYAHKIIDSFTEHLGNLMLTGTGSLFNGLHSNQSHSLELNNMLAASDMKCYPMAFECRSWAAFKAGECGYCTSEPGDSGGPNLGCVFVGVMQVDQASGEDKEEVTKQYVGNALIERSNRDGMDEEDEDELPEDDDDKINGEDYYKDENEISGGQTQQQESGGKQETAEDRIKRKAIEHVSRGQHFIRLGADSPTCLFHYQIIVAVNKSLSNSKLGGISKQARHSFYLQMPLNKQAMLTDSSNNKNRLQDRLVQISHVNRVDSYAHNRISEELLTSLEDNFEPVRELSISKYDIDYYSALITFKSVNPNMCREGDILPSNLDDSKGNRRFYLCKPFIEPREIQLWAPNGDQLEKVFWVAFNYMSNISRRGRLNLSYLFTRKLNQVKNRQQKKEDAAEPTLGELSRTSNRKTAASRSKYFTARALASLPSPSIIARSSLVQPIDCLISTLNPAQSGSTANNLKCNASGAELKYSLKMEPVKRQMTD